MSVEIAIPDDPLVGRTVAGRFEILARVGSGGMGTVYRARQMPLERNVALKLLKEEVSWDPDTVTRFHREAKAMSLLQHPNTVRVFDFGQTDDEVLFLAMELLEGETLSERLTREGELDPTSAIRIVQQILASLHEAHAKGIVHRDLKPDNIVLADVQGHAEAVVKVLDFGIAKVFEGENDFDSLETQAGTVFGTPRYMSPEQAQGKPLDPRSDLYSVGVLLYQLLTGVPPFRDDDAVVVMAKHIRDIPEPLTQIAPTRPITRRLEKAVLKALDKSRDKRFQDADAFSAALDHCLPELAAARASQTGVFGRARASKAPWVLAAVVLLTSIAIAAGILVSAAHDSDIPPDETLERGPSVATADPAPPTLLRTTLDSEPSGASVWQGDENLGTTPYIVEMGAGQRLDVELRLEGHSNTPVEIEAGLRRTVELVPVEPVAVRVNMRRRATMAAQMSEAVAEPVPEAAEMTSMSPYTRFGP